ncbi:hypothetical protein [Streptomyces sp. Amel2xC10]|uniref:hypothetical protein n=1 Tax=Streptomyces sp. Amel2xC10 TaxID=1305826 RepID=UPI000A08E194|nr:hypothetical protein [Streptomyces sp. Amel2xC10]SMF84055.1 hypothetical protein SAMN02745830_06764 [Streptomyces sp. Amel2xC10]
MTDVTPKGRDVRDVRNAPEALGEPDDLTEAPAPAADATHRETSASSAASASSASNPSSPSNPSSAPGALLPREESDKLTARLEHAVGGFVDGPRDAVEEADEVLQELAARLTDAVQRRRRALRGSWQPSSGTGEGGTKEGGTREGTSATVATTPDTEQLRLALRDYRELTERLLHV